jgi:hypothetical protein
MREIGACRTLLEVIDENARPSHQLWIDLLFLGVIGPDCRNKASVKLHA